ncbi:MAG: ABC transporter permease [Phycisphaerae bacterium]
MSNVWAVARQMIAEGLRMKIAVVFLVLMALLLLGLPFSVSGDSSQAGAVQGFLSYALRASGLLLGMLTIFLSRSLSDELVNKQILMLMTKPLPRWQYILGKWLGITVLNFVFLSFVGICVYGMVYVIQWRNPALTSYDAVVLKKQVLVARHGLKPEVPDFETPAEREFQQNLEQGLYDDELSLTPEEERSRLKNKYEARWRVVEPLGAREFEFKNVLCDRSQKNELQLRYRTNVSRPPPDEIYRCGWVFGDPLKGTAVYTTPVRHVIDRIHTVRFPADAVAEDNTLKVTFYNQNPYPDEPLFQTVFEFRKGDGPDLFFVVGSFWANLFRLLVLMQCKLMFLAAVAIFATTILSYPVACLVSFTVYVIAGARAFIQESLFLADSGKDGWFETVKEIFYATFSTVFAVLQWIVPDFTRYDGVETLVSGKNVSLVWVLQGVGDLAVLKTVIILGLAMLAFHRREVAEVSL